MIDFFKKITDSIKNHTSIVLMTHEVPDLDGLGSAIVFSEILKKMGKKCNIVAPKQLINKTLVKGLDYLSDFVIPFKYEDYIRGDLLIIFDTCENYMTECKNVLKITDKFIIDHHSKGDDIIDGNIYLNDMMSSTAEIICEYLKYLNIKLDNRFYTLLFAGMYQDTCGFKLKTLSNTFENAKYLIDNGADIIAGHNMLKESRNSIINRYDYVKKSMEISEGIFLCVLDDVDCNRIDVAKVADEVLEFEETKASIAIGKNNDEIYISARSCGDVDVFSYIKKLGGGGHFGAAAACMKGDIKEAVEKVKQVVRGGE